jgi:hypothetical protein
MCFSAEGAAELTLYFGELTLHATGLELREEE